MPTQNRRHATSWATVLGLLSILFPIADSALDRSSPPSPVQDSNTSYSPPMATVLVVVIGLFLTIGFLSIFFRHFTWCFGIDNNPGGGAGEEWRREAARGLDPSVVDSFPKFLYSDVKVHRIGKGTLECAVCLTEFSDDEALQMLPVCSHVFHPDCISPWLASHVTCPVCRSNLEFQHRRQHFENLLQQLHIQLSDNESEPSDQNPHHHDDHHNRDVITSVAPSPKEVVKSTPVQEIKDGGERMGKLPRSHSTGHSLVEDCERFTLKLPDEVHNKLVNASHSILPAMISPRIGYRSRTVGCTGFPVKPDRWRFSASPPFISRPSSIWSPKSELVATGSSHVNSDGIMNGPKNFLKSIKSPLNRGTRSSDIGERSSDKLWPNRRSQDVESEGQ